MSVHQMSAGLYARRSLDAVLTYVWLAEEILKSTGDTMIISLSCEFDIGP